MTPNKERQSAREIAAEKKQRKTDEVTRKVALWVVFVAVFYFFIKLLFL